MALRRSACSDRALKHRCEGRVSLDVCAGCPIAIDGYNLLITIEAAMSGGLVIVGRDGCYRDLASIHGTYRKVEETIPALNLIADYLARADISRVDWYLDRPVSNSGRLKCVIAEVIERRADAGFNEPTWNIELANNPDAILAGYDGYVATADSAVLDRRSQWINLAAEMVDVQVPDAWRLDLRTMENPMTEDL